MAPSSKALAALRALNLSLLPKGTTIPVAIFVGGTSGIGKAMAESFAEMTEGRSTIVLVGRNRTAATNILSSLPTTPESKREFVQCDATLMRNVEVACAEILAKHDKVNYLVLSPGFISMKGFDPSAEGIDRKLATNYYARWKFIDQLLPALKRAKEEGEDAKVFSVLGAGAGGAIDINDLGLKKSYSTTNSALASPTYNDLMMEEFASRNPNLTFIHGYPGSVSTDYAAAAESTAIRRFAPVIKTLMRPFSVTPAECAENMWSAIFNHSDGVYRTGAKGQNLEKYRYFGNDEQRKALWEHTVDAVNAKASS